MPETIKWLLIYSVAAVYLVRYGYVLGCMPGYERSYGIRVGWRGRIVLSLLALLWPLSNAQDWIRALIRRWAGRRDTTFNSRREDGPSKFGR